MIDATVHASDGGFLMAFKDERGINDPTTAYKNIAITTFTTPWSEFAEPTMAITPSPVEAPSLFRRGDEWVLIFDYFLEGGYGALRSVDLVHWEPADVSLPRGMRHASVLSLPDAHRRR